MELGDYFRVVRKWWWLIVASTLIATIGGYLAISRTPRIYQSVTTARVGPSGSDPVPSNEELWISQQLAQTYRDMATRGPILQGVADALGLAGPPPPGNISAGIVPGTTFLEIRVRDTDPERARAVADEIVHQLFLQSSQGMSGGQERREFVERQIQRLEQLIEETESEIEAARERLAAASGAREIRQLQSDIEALNEKLAGYQSTYASLLNTQREGVNTITPFEPAYTPTRPISPNVMQTILLATATGLVVGLAGAFLIEFLDDTIKTPEDVRRAMALPTLASILRIGGGSNGNHALVTMNYPQSLISEAYRMLRTNIQVSSIDEPIRTIVVTSAGPFEGKSTTAANLAVVMAQAGKRVILVDSDLRRSSLHKVFGVPNDGGLTHALMEEELALDAWLEPTEIDNLRLLPSGPLPPNPSELLGSKKMRELIDSLQEEADAVIFDSPPPLPVTDALILSLETDAVLLIADAGHTRRAAARKVAEDLSRAGANVIGVVLNRIQSDGLSGYHYYGRSEEA